MALVLQGSIADEQVRLSFDVVNNRVVGAELVNGSTRVVRVSVSRTQGNKNVEVDVAAGQTLTRSFPGNQRFDYDTVTAEWNYSLGWAD